MVTVKSCSKTCSPYHSLKQNMEWPGCLRDSSSRACTENLLAIMYTHRQDLRGPVSHPRVIPAMFPELFVLCLFFLSRAMTPKENTTARQQPTSLFAKNRAMQIHSREKLATASDCLLNVF